MREFGDLVCDANGFPVFVINLSVYVSGKSLHAHYKKVMGYGITFSNSSSGIEVINFSFIH